MLNGLFGREIDAFYIISQVFALAATLLGLYAIQRKKKIQIINYGVVGSFCSLIHYLLLGAWSGVAIKVVGTIRNGIAGYETHKHKKSKIFPLIFVTFYIVSGFLTYDSVFSILPMISASTYTIAIYMADAKIIRYAAVFGSTLWLIYNIHVMTVVGIIAEVIFIINDLIAIRRYRDKKHKKAPKKVPVARKNK